MTTDARDRIRGALLGAAIGDALGAPYEFNGSNPKLEIDGYGRGVFGTAPGSSTDDTQLTAIHAEAMYLGDDDDTTFVEEVVARLIKWLDNGPADVGSTTFGSIQAWKRGDVPLEANPSNGALMAVSPAGLAARSEAEAYRYAVRYAALTHPNVEVYEACGLYAAALWRLVEGESPGAVCSWLRRVGRAVGVEDRAGYVWVAFNRAADTLAYLVHEPATPFEALRWLIAAGGDTDTNACIAGALLGAADPGGFREPAWLLGDLVDRKRWVQRADALAALR